MGFRSTARFVCFFLLVLSAISGCAPFEYAINVLDDVSEVQSALYPPTLVPSLVSTAIRGPLWTVDHINAYPNLGVPEICATQSEVAISGGRRPSFSLGVFVLDGKSGNPLWAQTGLSKLRVTCAEDAVFVASSTSIWRRNPSTRQVEWHRTVPWPTDIIHLHHAEGKLYAWTRPDAATTILDAASGDVLVAPTVNDSRQLLLIARDAVFAGYGNITAYDVVRDEPLWTDDLEARVYEPPSFDESIVYVRTGEAIGTVYALDRSTGEVLWATGRHILSNLLHSDGSLYVLTEQGELQALDPITGAATTLMRFQPAPLPVGGYPVGYYLAMSEPLHLIYIYIGDTRQLMAYEILPLAEP